MQSGAKLKPVQDDESEDEEHGEIEVPAKGADQKSSEEEAKTAEENARRERKFLEEWNTRIGDMLPDDLVNHIADIIQSKSKKKIGGLFAVQFSSLSPDMIRKSITPEHDSAQIIFDRDRTHFFLVHYRADLKIVVIYDSMHGICKDGQNAMGKIPIALRKKLYALFGHLFPSGEMRIAIDTAFAQQVDAWSCGLRALAGLVDIASDKNPSRCEYSRRAIYDLICVMAVSDKKEYEWKQVADFDLGDEREVDEASWICFFLYSDCTLMYDPCEKECEEIIALARAEAKKPKTAAKTPASNKSTPSSTPTNTSGIASGAESEDNDDDEYSL